MKTAIIKSSQLVEHGRWDASFHICVDETRAEVEAMQETEDEAFEMICVLETQSLHVLSPLIRSERKDRDSLLRAAREYPHIALALLRRNLTQEIARVDEEIMEKQRLKNRLAALKGGDPC